MPYAVNEGVRIYYEVVGKGLPLILMHGHTMGIVMWHYLGYVAALKDDYRLILVDLRGHGKSDKPTAAEDYLPRPVTRDVLAVLDDVGVERAHYFGHSCSAGAGYVLAAESGERFHSMILVSCSPYTCGTVSRQMHGQMLAVVNAGLERMVMSIEKSDQLPPPVREHILRNDHRSMVAWMWGTDRWPDLEPLLPAIKLPCLLCVGDRDALHDGAREGAAAMRNATFVSLPGVAHLGAFLRSDLVLPHVRTFLAKVSGPMAAQP